VQEVIEMKRQRRKLRPSFVKVRGKDFSGSVRPKYAKYLRKKYLRDILMPRSVSPRSKMEITHPFAPLGLYPLDAKGRFFLFIKPISKHGTSARAELDKNILLLRRGIPVPKPAGIIKNYYLSVLVKGEPLLNMLRPGSFAQVEMLAEKDKGVRNALEMRKKSIRTQKEINAKFDRRCDYLRSKKINFLGWGERKADFPKLNEFNAQRIEATKGRAKAAARQQEEISRAVKENRRELKQMNRNIRNRVFESLAMELRKANEKGVYFQDIAPRNIIAEERKGKVRIAFLDFENTDLKKDPTPLLENKRKTQLQRLQKLFGAVDILFSKAEWKSFSRIYWGKAK